METENIDISAKSSGLYTEIIIGSVIGSALYITGIYSFNLFHALAEIITVIIAFGVSGFAYHSRKFTKNSFLLFIGIAYFFIAIIDMAHIFTFSGMGLLKGYSINTTILLSLISGFLQSASLFAAVYFTGKNIKGGYIFGIYITLTALLAAAVFYWAIFPSVFVEGQGTTFVKKNNHYIISIIFFFSALILRKKRDFFDSRVFYMLFASIIFSIGSTLTFAFYSSISDKCSIIAHLLRLASYCMIYRAIIKTGFENPYAILFRDIKQKEDALQKSEMLYRTLFEKSGDAVFLMEAEGQSAGIIIATNQAAADMHGMTVKEIIGMNIKELDTLEAASVFDARINRIFRGEWIYGELTHRKSDGSIFPVEISAGLIETQGHKYILAFDRDITAKKEMEEELLRYQKHLEDLIAERTAELKESETRYQALVDAQPDAICRWLPDTTLTFVNEGYCRFFGKTKDELLGRQWLDFVPESSRKTVADFYRKLVLKPKIYRYEHEAINAKGEICWQEWIDIPIFDISGLLAEFQSSGRDITERKKMEYEIKTKQAQLIHADRMASLGLMASGIAHEINNPNNFILATMQIVTKFWEDAQPIFMEYRRGHGDFSLAGLPFCEAIETIPTLISGVVEGSWRIKNIVDSLREFAIPDKNGSMGTVDINKAVAASISIMSHMIEKHTGKFHFNPADGLPLVKGNKSKIEQVMINLIMNALHALPDRQREIEISTGFDENSGHIVIKVKDEGSGIPEEHLSRLTEPFFSTKFTTGGSGLGLFISHYIVREHGGSMEFESEVGKGTTVTVKLPVGL